MMTGGGIKTNGTPDITSLAVVVEGALLLLALGIGWLIGHPPIELVRVQWPGLILGAVATIPLIVVVWGSTRTQWRPIHRFVQQVEEKVFAVVGGLSRMDVVLISCMAGIAEEFMFRGLIQPGLGRLSDPTVALVVTSLLFGLAHLVTISYALVAALMGLYLGWIATASDNLLVPIVAHALYDLWALTYLIEHRGAAIRDRLERADAMTEETS